jgi:hypothetical protein
MSDDWTTWTNKPSYMSAQGAQGLTLRSLSGNGLIDGHAKGWYQRYHGSPYITGVTDPYEYQPVLMLIEGSEDVRVSNIRLKNAPREFVRVDAGNVGVAFEDLSIVVEDQWSQFQYTLWESSALKLRNSSSVHLTNINVDFRSTATASPSDEGVGGCILLDWGLNDVSIDSVKCSGTFFGVVMQFGTVDMDKCVDPPPYEAQVSQNIVIRNYTANSDHNLGFLNAIRIRRPQVHNLTYENVNFVGGGYLENSNYDDCPIYIMDEYQCNYTDVWFKNFKGNLGRPWLPSQCSGYDCLNKMNGNSDFHFEGMPKYVPPSA